MPSLSRALQTALYTRLAALPKVQSKEVLLTDASLHQQRLPLIQLGEEFITDWSSKTFTGFEHRCFVHVWSNSPGLGEVKALLASVADALTTQPFEVSGAQLHAVYLQASRVLRERDGRTLHGVLELRVRLIKD
jgi:Protein of unknown function (DUF3168)